eukprot:GHVP01045664.1.p1 GENE.GHVP01045664.1~~GHVP01045664.1.p1  ORF type:complete len:135 (+),score=17.11 GHVP01045664.1:215-619(+)
MPQCQHPDCQLGFEDLNKFSIQKLNSLTEQFEEISLYQGVRFIKSKNGILMVCISTPHPTHKQFEISSLCLESNRTCKKNGVLGRLTSPIIQGIEEVEILCPFKIKIMDVKAAKLNLENQNFTDQYNIAIFGLL